MFVRLSYEHTPDSPTVDGQRMRAHNASLLLQRIWAAAEGVSRADLARDTGLSRSTVSAIVGDLLGAGLVIESHHVRGVGSGRPPCMLVFHESAFAIVGVEMGASHVTAVLCDPRGTVLAHDVRGLDVQADPVGTLAVLDAMIAACLDAARDRRVLGIGLAVPCPLDATAPGALSERILPAWRGIRPAEHLHARFGLGVFMDNDANLGALAEHWWGACRGVDCATYIKVATGVGAGHLVNGRLFRGANGIAGEIGHTAVAGSSGHPCRCGLTGCLEAEIGSGAIVSQARERLVAGSPSALARVEDLDLAAIVTAAKAGDPLAVELIASSGRFLGVAVANLVNLMNPARIVLGGRLSQAGELLLGPLRSTVLERALRVSIDRVDVVLSALGDDHVAVGAATLVLEAALASPDSFTQPRPSVRGPSSPGAVHTPPSPFSPGAP